MTEQLTSFLNNIGVENQYYYLFLQKVGPTKSLIDRIDRLQTDR